MLTEAEKQACREARFTGGRGHCWGTPKLGLCPVGKVAEMRGAVFTLPPDAHEYTSFDVVLLDTGRITFKRSKSTEIAEQAMVDVMAWLGMSSWDEFLDALEAQGTAIFPADEVPA